MIGMNPSAMPPSPIQRTTADSPGIDLMNMKVMNAAPRSGNAPIIRKLETDLNRSFRKATTAAKPASA